MGRNCRDSGSGTVAAVSADGRTYDARPVDGGGIGCTTELAVLATSEADVREALDWIPGRILVLAEAALEPRTLALVVPSAHMATLSGIVLLGDDRLDLSPLTKIDAVVPVVCVEDLSDQRCVRRALRLTVDVRIGSPPLIDLRRPHRMREPRATISLGEPGLVRRSSRHH